MQKTHVLYTYMSFAFLFIFSLYKYFSFRVVHCAIFCESYAAEDEREFDYLEGSEMGPRHWGDIRKEWAACKNGDMQSPIDMSSQRVKSIPKLGELKRSYKPSNATIKNRGHDISVRKESYQTI